MEVRYFVGIDTSNYTTSVAVAESLSGRVSVVANLKRPLDVAEGQRGLRQSDAVFAHTRNLPELLEKAGKVLVGNSPAAVGYSFAPRDADGSYMPCFLPGKAAAYAMASGCGAGTFAFSHQAGHIRAALYSSGMVPEKGERFIAFHLSGGTTELLSVVSTGGGFVIERLGGTLDISCGQAVDRIGVMLGLRFPAGAEMEKEALGFGGILKDRPQVCVNGADCNLSGLENLARKLKDEGAERGYISAFTIDYIGRIVEKMTAYAKERYPDARIVYSGGVMSNSLIKERLRSKVSFFAEPEYSSDNAAGTALLAADAWLADMNEKSVRQEGQQL